MCASSPLGRPRPPPSSTATAPLRGDRRDSGPAGRPRGTRGCSRQRCVERAALPSSRSRFASNQTRCGGSRRKDMRRWSPFRSQRPRPSSWPKAGGRVPRRTGARPPLPRAIVVTGRCGLRARPATRAHATDAQGGADRGRGSRGPPDGARDTQRDRRLSRHPASPAEASGPRRGSRQHHRRAPVEALAFLEGRRRCVGGGPPRLGDAGGTRLFNFLPMDDRAVSPTAGHIDAPCFADIDRRSIKPDLPINKHLLEAAARAAAQAALAIVDGNLELPETAIVDLAAWSGPHMPKVIEAFAALKRPLAKAAIWPVVSAGPTHWARFSDLYAWPDVHTHQLTPSKLANVVGAAIVSSSIGEARLVRVRALAATVSLPLAPAEDTLARWVEAIAADLAAKRRQSPRRWRDFYDDVVAVYAATSLRLSFLEGKKLFPDNDDRLLRATARGLDGAPRVFHRIGRERGRCGERPPSPPSSLSRKFRFLNQSVEISEAGLRAFEKAGLLRRYDPLEALNGLKGALGNSATDTQRREALVWAVSGLAEHEWEGGRGRASRGRLVRALPRRLVPRDRRLPLGVVESPWPDARALPARGGPPVGGRQRPEGQAGRQLCRLAARRIRRPARRLVALPCHAGSPRRVATNRRRPSQGWDALEPLEQLPILEPAKTRPRRPLDGARTTEELLVSADRVSPPGRSLAPAGPVRTPFPVALRTGGIFRPGRRLPPRE
jgi:hypothetical protein